MSNATENHMVKLKRYVRFIRTLPRVVAEYQWNALPDQLEIHSDSDHAGCNVTRKSTLGGAILWGADM